MRVPVADADGFCRCCGICMVDFGHHPPVCLYSGDGTVMQNAVRQFLFQGAAQAERVLQHLSATRHTYGTFQTSWVRMGVRARKPECPRRGKSNRRKDNRSPPTWRKLLCGHHPAQRRGVFGRTRVEQRCEMCFHNIVGNSAHAGYACVKQKTAVAGHPKRLVVFPHVMAHSSSSSRSPLAHFLHEVTRGVMSHEDCLPPSLSTFA